MIKGFRFTNQLSNAEVDARIHQEFLNKNDGIFYGMELSRTNNSITISEGLCEIAGRPIAVIDSETIAVSMESLYCLLILEIDLSKESTKDVFNQVSFKLLTSGTNYPIVTQQDINIYNGTNTTYQLEFARFRSDSRGITDFKDTRKMLSFNGIYNQIQKECKKVLDSIKSELASIQDGSSYILKDNLAILTGKIEMPEKNDSTITGQTHIDYPPGFSKDNSLVISLMSHPEVTGDNWGWTTSNGNGSSSSMIYGNDTLASLRTSDIRIAANKLGVEVPRKDILFKLTLMRI